MTWYHSTRHDMRSSLPLQTGIGFALLVFTYVNASVDGSYLIDGQGLVAGPDFFNIWHYGLAAFSDDRLYGMMSTSTMPVHHR